MPPADENGNGIRITNRELFDEQKETQRAVQSLRELILPLTDLPSRVRKLEFRYYGLIAGLLGAIAILVKGSL